MSRIKISLKGNNVRRFINLCSSNDIELYDLKYASPDEYTCTINTNDYYEMKKHLKKTRTKSRVISRLGIYRLHKPFMKYWYCLLPFILIVTFLYWKTLKISEVVVSGGQKSLDESIEAYINDNNLGIGTWISSYDCTRAEQLLKKEFASITWSTIGIKGNVLYVEVREATEPEHISQGESRDIVAKSDAIIYSIVTRNGTPLVKKGDTVLEGEILVSARQDILDDNLEIKDSFYVCSDADVLGCTDRVVNKKIYYNSGFLRQDEKMLFILAEAYTDKYVCDLEENGVLILSKNVMMDKVGDCLYLNLNLKTIESIVKYSY